MAAGTRLSGVTPARYQPRTLQNNSTTQTRVSTPPGAHTRRGENAGSCCRADADGAARQQRSSGSATTRPCSCTRGVAAGAACWAAAGLGVLLVLPPPPGGRPDGAAAPAAAAGGGAAAAVGCWLLGCCSRWARGLLSAHDARSAACSSHSGWAHAANTPPRRRRCRGARVRPGARAVADRSRRLGCCCFQAGRPPPPGCACQADGAPRQPPATVDWQAGWRRARRRRPATRQAGC